MSQANTQAANVTNEASERKARRQRFGVSEKPVVAVAAYRKAMSFDHKNVSAESWVLITPDNKLIRANLYDGKAGKSWDQTQFTHPKPGEEKELNRKLKGYTKAEKVSDCPIAISPEDAAAQATQPQNTSAPADNTPAADAA